MNVWRESLKKATNHCAVRPLAIRIPAISSGDAVP
jgi:hypothetical protein